MVRHGDGGILDEDMQHLVRAQRLGYVATVCKDGTPNVSPKGTVTVWDNNHLMFVDLRSPGTVRNLAANPAIEINVVDPIRRRGYRFRGTGQVLRHGELFDRILDFYRQDGLVLEWQGNSRVRSVVLVHVERVLPLTSPAYDLGRSEEEIAAQWRRYYCDCTTTSAVRRKAMR